MTKALEQRARRAARRHWTSVLRWDPLGRLRRSCASDPRRRYEYEAVFQAQVELVTGMLAIDFEIEKEGMTVPYPQLFNDIGRNHGFVDLRGRPDLAIEIPEGSQSPALKAILVELSEPDSPLFTSAAILARMRSRGGKRAHVKSPADMFN